VITRDLAPHPSTIQHVRLDEIPEAFVALERAGRFDYWGAPYQTLTEQQRQELLPQRMRQVLWWDQVIEWDRTVEDVVAFDRDGLLRPGLVPFAGNGYGDQYCWYPRWQDDREPPVVLFVHDELESRLFARGFADFLGRCMLQHFAADGSSADGPGRSELWSAHLDIVRPYVDGEPGAVLGRIGGEVDPRDCAAADAELAALVGVRTMLGALQPTQFQDESIVEFAGWASLLESYDRSVAFYEELVHDEGLAEYAAQLDQARTARGTARRNQASRP
jgi:hypothetical protein